jgi:hypothetical protein
VPEGSGACRPPRRETIYLQVLDLSDLEHLELLAAEVMPKV